jgi:ELWxxDGT repeat protein
MKPHLIPLIAALAGSWLPIPAFSQTFEATNVYDEPYGYLSPSDLTAANGKVYFSGKPSYEIGVEPYVSDGTRAGTFRLKDIATSRAGDSDPTTFTKVGNSVYFYARSETHGRELWVTDGTSEGTRLVIDLWPGTKGSVGLNRSNDEQSIAEFNGRALFIGNDGINGRELWITDGTAVGTERLTNINATPEGSSHFGREFFVWNNVCFFQAGDDNYNAELWRTDGTVAGTYEVKDLYVGYPGYPSRFIEMGGDLYFQARANSGSYSLYTTDGTANGTIVIKEISSGNNPLYWLTVKGNILYFTASSGGAGRELWRSDGTELGTYQVDDLRVGGNSSNPEYLTVIGSTLYFVADNGQSGKQLWKTNGQPGNASLVMSLAQRNGVSNLEELVEFQNTLFFKMNYVDPSGRAYGKEWFYLDAAGNLQNAGDVNPGPNSGPRDGNSVHAKYAKTANGLYFSGNDYGGYPNYELWRISRKLDITSQPLAAVVKLGEPHTLSFTADQAVTSVQWYQNGTAISGATSPSYTISGAVAEDAGLYYASCSNADAAATTASAKIVILESSAQPVGVIAGSTLRLSVTVHGTGVSYQWKRGNVSLSDDGSRVVGARSASLVINDVVSTDAGNYYCKVTISGASGESHRQAVSFVTQPVVDPTPPPSALVSGAFDWQLAATQSPSLFLVKRLPPGLRYDPNSGRITGHPNRVGTYRVQVVAYNIVGKSETQTFEITVDPLPDYLSGSYFGEITRNTELNFNLGGSVTLQTDQRGTLSGKMNLAGKIVRFRGRLNASPTGTSSASIAIPVRGTAAYQFDITFDPNLHSADGTLSRNGQSVSFRTDRNVWHSRANPNHLYSGRFNSGLDLSNTHNGNEIYPQGHGYTTMQVSTNGKARIVGHAGDGARFTVSTIVSHEGTIPLFAPMHRNHASLHGIQAIQPAGAAPEYSDTLINGTIYWIKKPNAKASGRSYPNGFPRVAVATYGGKWTATKPGEMLLGIDDSGEPNAKLDTFYGTLPNLTNHFTLTDRHKAIFDRTTNTHRASVLFNARLGTFRGSFHTTDTHPLRPERVLSRKAILTGVIVPQWNRGYGQFTISALPTINHPSPNTVTGALLFRSL